MTKVIYPEAGSFFVKPLGRFVKRVAGEMIEFRSERTAKIYADTMNEWNHAEVCKLVA